MACLYLQHGILESHDVEVEEPFNLEQSNMEIGHSVGETSDDIESSNPSKAKSSRRFSKVWDSFIDLPLGDDKIPRSKCRQCGKVYQTKTQHGTDDIELDVDELCEDVISCVDGN
ncbi:hypothetical protein FRX31_003591 [Thalictrum thalictroides]|uniref:BED-type domain-containing protein n=1 Tax=Thalictrum thalictroides TaxID=46969 RepID=A0A7J6XAL2_THATH|nr:hypothetical protein FRX31_003591 [Thalictrum thalictroides]